MIIEEEKKKEPEKDELKTEILEYLLKEKGTNQIMQPSFEAIK